MNTDNNEHGFVRLSSMTSNFLDNTCTKIQNIAFKTSQMDQIALEYWYYGFLGRLRVDGRGFLHQNANLEKLSAGKKSSCRTCAEACHSPFKPYEGTILMSGKVCCVQYLLVFRLISGYTGVRLIPGLRGKDWILRALLLAVKSLWPDKVGSRVEIYSTRWWKFMLISDQ